MSAESIARVMRDIRMGRIESAEIDPSDELMILNADTVELSKWADVIDVTPVFDRWLGGEARYAYEDHLACPPWQNAFLCYENGFGNVTAMSTRAIDIIDITTDLDVLIEKWESLADDHEIDWGRVKWITHIAVYMGGRSGDAYTPVYGPMHCWRIAIYPDGEIADINWIQVCRADPGMWDNALMTWLDAVNMCNCVNVQIAEPDRPRPQRKRLARAGFTVNEIHIKPVSKSYRGKGTPLSAVSSGGPLSSVRGHFASYGPQYGRGLLFGKYAGRYWISQHIRGSEAHGVSEQEYSVEP